MKREELIDLLAGAVTSGRTVRITLVPQWSRTTNAPVVREGQAVLLGPEWGSRPRMKLGFITRAGTHMVVGLTMIKKAEVL